MSAETEIRPMTAADLNAVGKLLKQLGYTIPPDELKHRLDAVDAADGNLVLVADARDAVCGLVHVFARPALEKPLEAVVQALVIDEAVRGTGIGRDLMAAAEEWARARGFASVAVATRVTRDDANAFYAQLGYEQLATSHLRRKKIVCDP